MPNLACIALLVLGSPVDDPPSVPPQWLSSARPKVIARVVTVAPSLTELLYGLGLYDRVVAVSRYDDYPAGVEKLPRVGGFLDPNVEAIVGLRPDLVLAVPNQGNRPALDRLARLGVPVYVVPGNTFADVFVAIRAVGALFPGEGAKAAVRLEAELVAELRRIEEARVGRSGPKVAVVYGYEPLILAGPGSFADTMLEVLGAQNLVQTGSAYPQYSAEALVRGAPEVILDATEAHGVGAAPWARFTDLPAVRAGRVHAVPLGSLLRPGPRLLEGLRLLERLLYSAGSKSISK